MPKLYTWLSAKVHNSITSVPPPSHHNVTFVVPWPFVTNINFYFPNVGLLCLPSIHTAQPDDTNGKWFPAEKRGKKCSRKVLHPPLQLPVPFRKWHDIRNVCVMMACNNSSSTGNDIQILSFESVGTRSILKLHWHANKLSDRKIYCWK